MCNMKLSGCHEGTTRQIFGFYLGVNLFNGILKNLVHLQPTFGPSSSAVPQLPLLALEKPWCCGMSAW